VRSSSPPPRTSGVSMGPTPTIAAHAITGTHTNAPQLQEGKRLRKLYRQRVADHGRAGEDPIIAVLDR
jgi:hypothetical protein